MTLWHETAALQDFDPAYVRNGSIASDQRSHGLAGCPLHLQERPNIRTAAKRGFVPIGDIYTAANNRRYSITSSARC